MADRVDIPGLQTLLLLKLTFLGAELVLIVLDFLLLQLEFDALLVLQRCVLQLLLDFLDSAVTDASHEIV